MAVRARVRDQALLPAVAPVVAAVLVVAAVAIAGRARGRAEASVAPAAVALAAVAAVIPGVRDWAVAVAAVQSAATPEPVVLPRALAEAPVVLTAAVGCPVPGPGAVVPAGVEPAWAVAPGVRMAAAELLVRAEPEAEIAAAPAARAPDRRGEGGHGTAVAVVASPAWRPVPVDAALAPRPDHGLEFVRAVVQ